MKNNAPTPAQTSAYDSDFSAGAGVGVGTTNANGRSQIDTIATRRDRNKFRGNDNQPIRTIGERRKFFDASENHPVIPKSSMRSVTQDTDAVPSASGRSSLPADS